MSLLLPLKFRAATVAVAVAVAVAVGVAVAFEFASAFDVGPRLWSHVAGAEIG